MIKLVRGGLEHAKTDRISVMRSNLATHCEHGEPYPTSGCLDCALRGLDSARKALIEQALERTPKMMDLGLKDDARFLIELDINSFEVCLNWVNHARSLKRSGLKRMSEISMDAMDQIIASAIK